MNFHVAGQKKQHPANVLFSERPTKRSNQLQLDLYTVGLWLVAIGVSYLVVREFV